MSSSSASKPRICPECGTPNSGLSLFCAECGASLMDDPEDATQTTSAFAPPRDPHATAEFTPLTNASTQETISPPPVWTAPEPDATWTAAHEEPVDVSYAPPESRRGLVLGWIASVLIALVIAFVIWSALLSPDTRDTITGWFT